MIDPGWERRPVRTFVGLVAVLVSLFFGGIAVGLAIALSLGGGSIGAIVVGFLFLPIVLGLGMSAWRALLLAWMAGGLLGAMVRSRGDEAAFRREAGNRLRDMATEGLPGTWVFVPIASAVALVASLLMAIAADGDRLVAGGAVLVVGIAYGILLRRLATRGLLPVPED